MQTFWTRLNTLLLMLVLLAVIAVIGYLATGARGGPLDPPGAPGSTAGVQLPGTPITSLPATIDTPGNYYLTGNLTMPSSGNGITINATDVTLDLGGFVLDGGGVGTNGISMFADNVTVRNGTSTRWQVGIRGTGSGSQVSVEQVRATHNTIGILLFAGSISDCTVSNNSGAGVSATSTGISRCTATANQIGFDLFDGSTLTDCSTNGNTRFGIHASGTHVTSCSSFRDQTGMNVGSGADIRGNVVRSSTSDGIQVSSVATVADNTVSASGGSGIAVLGVSARISRNSASSNFGNGIYCEGSSNMIDENSALGNSGVGIDVPAGSGNTVVLNSARSNSGGNYFFVGAQNFAPITSAAAATNPWSNTQ